MPRKVKPSASSQLYVVTVKNGVDSVFASATAANERAAKLKTKEVHDGSIKIELHELQGGTVNATSAMVEDDNIAAAKTSDKVPQQVKATAEAGTSKADATATKKTKSAAEQRAVNAEKPDKPTDADLPENIQRLLSGTGDVLSGFTVVVTGVPPTLGRKNAEKLVTAYGGKLTKSLSKNTNYVVVGNEAGPKKLEQIEGLGLKTLDEDALIEMLESNGGGSATASKRDAEEEEEGEQAPKKKQKK